MLYGRNYTRTFPESNRDRFEGGNCEGQVEAIPKTCNVDDDELIAQVTRVCAEESERDNKLDKHKVKMARGEQREVLKRKFDRETITRSVPRNS